MKRLSGRLLALIAAGCLTASGAAYAARTPAPEGDAPAAAAVETPKTEGATPSPSPPPLPENASGADILMLGKNLYDYGDYPEMVRILELGLEKSLFSSDEEAEVHQMLGIGHFILQNRPKAREHFLQLLTGEPTYQLDPIFVPPIIIEYFESLREENRELLAAILAQRRGEQQAEPPEGELLREKNPYFVNFIPFGAGQFQNGEPIKGTLFLTGEIVALGLNAAGYFVSREFAGDDGYYTSGNAEQARQWRIVQYAGLGALGALVIGGVIDAILNYKEYNEIVVEPPAANEEKKTAGDEGKPKVDVPSLRVDF
ncbi:MAG: hypothetical protein C4523_02930 [Myxococcales bacterium]|nr:MAG: hypothetical protein C4523_02930 [Myxococcales bacterium]